MIRSDITPNTAARARRSGSIKGLLPVAPPSPMVGRPNARLYRGAESTPLCSRQGVQERLQRVWVDLATGYDLDGIHHDFIRLATSAYDYSRSSLQQFQSWVRPWSTPSGTRNWRPHCRTTPTP